LDRWWELVNLLGLTIAAGALFALYKGWINGDNLL
jgi:hypothetical protein